LKLQKLNVIKYLILVLQDLNCNNAFEVNEQNLRYHQHFTSFGRGSEVLNPIDSITTTSTTPKKVEGLKNTTKTYSSASSKTSKNSSLEGKNALKKISSMNSTNSEDFR